MVDWKQGESGMCLTTCSLLLLLLCNAGGIQNRELNFAIPHTLLEREGEGGLGMRAYKDLSTSKVDMIAAS